MMPIVVPPEELDRYTKEELAQRVLQAEEQSRILSANLYDVREKYSALKDDVKRYKRIIDNLMEQV